MTRRDEFLAVLSGHRLEAGTDYYAGEICCAGCDVVLGDPMLHLVNVLAEALDPDYVRPASTPRREAVLRDPRESQVVWEAS